MVTSISSSGLTGV